MANDLTALGCRVQVPLCLYPAGIDNLINPLASDYLSAPAHDVQHAMTNDILTALMRVVGTNSGYSSLNAIQFDTTPTAPAHAIGLLYFDTAWQTLGLHLGTDVNVQIGQETMAYVYNATGGNILNGEACYISGASGIYPTVAKAQANAEATSFVLGVATTTINAGAYGYVTIRGMVNDLNTNAWSVGDSLYLSETTAGALTNVPPSAGNYDVRVGRVIVKDPSVGSVYVNIRQMTKLTDLSDVTITTPTLDQIIRYNGTEWVNGAPVSASASVGIEFFNATPEITAVGANNATSIMTLSKTPVVTAEQTNTITANGNTVIGTAWLYNTALGRTSIDAGVWEFDVYAAVSSISGGRVTNVTRNIYSVYPQDGAAITVTTTGGAGATRTATASGGTPFASAKCTASATNTDASYLQTPQGIYQITGYTSDTVVTISTATITGYANESGVAFSVWKKLFGASTATITSIGTNYALWPISTTQGAFTVTALHKLGAITFATNTGGSTVVTLPYNGTTHSSHFSTPLITLHGNLAGLQGGTGSVPSEQYYHLTAAQHTSLTPASWANTHGLIYYNGTSLVADTAALTSGRVPYATANGRLTDSANLQYSGATHSILTLDTAATGYVSSLALKNNVTNAYTFSNRGTADAPNNRLALYYGGVSPTEIFNWDSSGGIDWTGGNVIYVPAGLTAAQVDAYCDAAADGDTLILAAATYPTWTTQVTISKQIHLKGMGSNKTLITTSYAGNPFVISVSNTLVSDMTVTATGAAAGPVFAVNGNIVNCGFENLILNNSGTGIHWGINFDQSGGYCRNIVGNISSSNSYCRFITGYVRSTTSAARTINVYDCVGILSTNTDSGSNGIFAVTGDGSEAFPVTMNIYNSRAVDTGGATHKGFLATQSCVLNAYNSSISAVNHDAFQANTATLTLSNCTLANNTTSGTITYAGTVVSSAAKMGYDTDTTSYFGRAAVGFATGYSDYAMFGHLDSFTASGFAFLAGAAGDCFINAASGQSIGFRNNNSYVGRINASGFILGGTAFGTSATNTVCLNSGTAPTTSPADAFQEYSADYLAAAGKACAHFRDEQGYVVPVGGEFVAQPYEQAGAILSCLTAPKLLYCWDEIPNSIVDLSNNGNTGTCEGSMTLLDNRLLQGKSWVALSNGTTQAISISDSDTLSFGNGSADTAVSMGGWFYITDTGAYGQLIAKFDETGGSELREWYLMANALTIRMNIYDEDANVQCCRDIDAPLTASTWYHIVAVYSGVGGATAANGITIYVNGVVRASTATNDANYVSMVNTTAKVGVMCQMNGSTPGSVCGGRYGQVFITGEELAAAKVWEMYIKTRGYYKQ